MHTVKTFRERLIRLFLMLIPFLSLCPLGADGAIYGYVEGGGAYHFTNIKPANRQYFVVIETREPPRGSAQHQTRLWLSDEERQGLISRAKTYLGVPYRLGGEGMGGIDCSAFVRKIFSLVDVALPRTAREQYGVGAKIAREELTVGDLVFFRTKRYEQYPTHVGIFIGDGQFIHASALNKGGVRIDPLSSEFYNARFIGGTRIRQLPENSSDTLLTASK